MHVASDYTEPLGRVKEQFAVLLNIPMFPQKSKSRSQHVIANIAECAVPAWDKGLMEFIGEGVYEGDGKGSFPRAGCGNFFDN